MERFVEPRPAAEQRRLARYERGGGSCCGIDQLRSSVRVTDVFGERFVHVAYQCLAGGDIHV